MLNFGKKSVRGVFPDLDEECTRRFTFNTIEERRVIVFGATSEDHVMRPIAEIFKTVIS